MLLPTITQKEQQIIQEILRFRFLQGSHIQKLLNHQDEKTILLWLNNLISKQYLVKDEEKLGRKNHPVYFLGIAGIRFLKTIGEVDPTLLHKLYWERQRSPLFISRCLLLVDICLTFQRLNVTEKGREREGVIFTCLTVSDYSSPLSPFSFLKELKPQLVVERVEGGERRYMLFEIFSPTSPSYRMRKRIRTYLKFLQSGDWEAQTRTLLPEVFFVLPERELKYRIKSYTKTLLQNTWLDLSINFTTEELVKSEGVTAEIWEQLEYD